MNLFQLIADLVRNHIIFLLDTFKLEGIYFEIGQLVLGSDHQSLHPEVRQLSVRKLRFIHNPFTRYCACAVRFCRVELFWNNDNKGSASKRNIILKILQSSFKVSFLFPSFLLIVAKVPVRYKEMVQ